MQILNTKIKKGSEKNFGILFAVLFFIISLWPLTYGGNFVLWSLILSFIFALLVFIKPKALKPLNYAWITFGNVLGHVVSPLVMAGIFFLVVTPISLLMKIIGKDLLNIKYSKKRSYWISKDKKIGSMRKQF